MTRAIALLLLAAVLMLAGCNAKPSETSAQGGNPQVGVGEIDFTATGITATPNPLLETDLLVIDATINNTSAFDTGRFEVRAFLKSGTNCDGSSYFIERRTMSVDAFSSTAFQVSRTPTNVPRVGTYYLCIFIDATDEVDEIDESNNLIGGTDYPVHIVNCLTDAACDDDNLCTDDVCDSIAGCRYVSNSSPCDDGLFCTQNDMCSGGACQRGEPRECSDSDLCDGTSYCDEIAGACQNGPEPVACDDGDACNGTETCNPSDGACIAGTPITCDVLVNNGLAPPTTSNVIDHALYDVDSSQSVLLRDFGCPSFGEPDSFCPERGTPTVLGVAAGSDVGELEVFDTSVLQVVGGAIDALVSGQDTTVSISGGIVESFEGNGFAMVGGGSHGLLRLFGQASVTGGVVESLELDSDFASPGAEMRGGVVTTLYSGTESSLRGGYVSLLCAREEPGVIYGTGFDQNAGRFGPLVGATGFVSGTLELGDPLNATFHQAGSWCYHPVDGTIATSGSFTLLPPESTFIANGMTSGSAENTLDANDLATQHHDVFVRNANCPDAWPSAYRDDPCSAPGLATEVEVASGAVIPGTITALDQSTVSIRGGQVSNLRLGSGASIEIWGDNFTVGGTPVAFGELTDVSGVLAGTLISTEAISASFDREDPGAPGNFGTIILRSAVELGGGT